MTHELMKTPKEKLEDILAKCEEEMVYGDVIATEYDAVEIDNTNFFYIYKTLERLGIKCYDIIYQQIIVFCLKVCPYCGRRKSCRYSIDVVSGLPVWIECRCIGKRQGFVELNLTRILDEIKKMPRRNPMKSYEKTIFLVNVYDDEGDENVIDFKFSFRLDIAKKTDDEIKNLIIQEAISKDNLVVDEDTKVDENLEGYIDDGHYRNVRYEVYEIDYEKQKKLMEKRQEELAQTILIQEALEDY